MAWNLARVGKQKLKVQVKQNLIDQNTMLIKLLYGQDVKRFN